VQIFDVRSKTDRQLHSQLRDQNKTLITKKAKTICTHHTRVPVFHKSNYYNRNHSLPQSVVCAQYTFFSQTEKAKHFP